MTPPIVEAPKRTVLGRKHVVWAIQVKSQCDSSTWAREEKIQDNKKSQKGYISPILREAPTGLIQPKSCIVGDVRDIITCAKFQIDIFMRYDFTGSRIFDFPIDFCMGLTTVQRLCTAYDYLTWLDCGEIQIVLHIINTCPLTEFDCDLLHLNVVDEAAITWLTTMAPDMQEHRDLKPITWLFEDFWTKRGSVM